MKVIVTGGAGFLGQYVVSELEHRGHRAIVVRSFDYDLREKVDCDRLFFRHFDADAVVHLAATVGGIGANQQDPGIFFLENILMGVHVMEIARAHGINSYLQAGTVCSYPKHCPVPFKESDLWEGYPEETNAPYGVAKRALITMAQAYRQQYGMAAVTVIPVNLYGPGDHDDLERSHVIPAMIRKFMEAKAQGEKKVVLWGTGTATREFLYVEDAAQGIVAALEKYDSPEPVNLGSSDEISIHDLACLISALVGFDGKIEFDPSRPDGQPRRKLDVTRARDAFGWTSKTNLTDGLKKTIESVQGKYS